MPVKTWATNDVPTASDFNTHYRDQVISTVTSGTRPSGTEGQHIYETDTDREYVYSGSGWVEWGGIGAWVSFTPTLTQSGAVTKTVAYARYFKIGRMVTVSWLLNVTGTGTATNAITMSLPFTAAQVAYGSGFVFDSSAGTYYPAILVTSGTTAVAFGDASQPSTGLFLGAGSTAFTAALASGDSVSGTTTYETTT